MISIWDSMGPFHKKVGLPKAEMKHPPYFKGRIDMIIWGRMSHATRLETYYVLKSFTVG